MRLDHFWDRDYRGMLARMRGQETEREAFLSRLDASRTVTLAGLLEDGSPAKKRIDASWIDMRRLRNRFGALAGTFLARLPRSVPGLDRLPLIFLQASPAAEDEEEFRRRSAEFGEVFTGRFGGRPPQACYLHTETNFFGDLQAAQGGLIVQPLGGFSSKSLALCEKEADWRNGPTIVGFRVPDYPRLLGVSAGTATDYLARLLIHDIGHGVLNPTPPEAEGMHNLLMIWVMQAKPSRQRLRKLSDWEALVLSECTDPFFYLEGWLMRYAEAWFRSHVALTPVQKALLEQYRKWYFSAAAKRKREKAWRFSDRWRPEMSERDWIRARVGRFLDQGIPLYEDRRFKRLAA